MNAPQSELLADDRCDVPRNRCGADVTHRVRATWGTYGFVIDWPHENQPRPILRCSVCRVWVCEDCAELSPGRDPCPQHARA